MALADRLLKARTAKKLTQTQLGKALGVTRNAVSLWESGVSQPRAETLRKAAVILEVGFDWLATGRNAQLNVVEGLTLQGEIAAGVWHEVTESQEMEFERVPVAPDPSYPVDAQYALRVRGTSVNKIAKDGSLVACVDIMEAGIEIRDRDLVVVERRRGSIVETTIKRVKKGKAGLELWPESDDPAHQEKLTLGPRRGDTEVSIKALVIWTANPIPRGS